MPPEIEGMPTVTAVLPALDEEASLGRVLDAVPRDWVGEVVVVDGGSRDRTPGVAMAHGARVIRQRGTGYGAACALGARSAAGDVVIFLDADGSADPRDIPALVAPIARAGADLVLGSRFADVRRTPVMPWHQRIGNRLCAFLIRLLYRQAITDLGPFRAVRRTRLNELTLKDATYGWPTEMIVTAARAGWQIAEVPVRCHARTGGRSKISGTVRGTVLATVHILRTIVRHVPA